MQHDWFSVLQEAPPLEPLLEPLLEPPLEPPGAAAATATRAAMGRRVARRKNMFSSGVAFWRAEESCAEDEMARLVGTPPIRRLRPGHPVVSNKSWATDPETLALDVSSDTKHDRALAVSKNTKCSVKPDSDASQKSPKKPTSTGKPKAIRERLDVLRPNGRTPTL